VIHACAKINLHLRVLNKREDGYHNIVSLMASIGIHDLLKLEDIRETGDAGQSAVIYNRGGACGDITESIPAGQNLIEKASKAYFRTAGIDAAAVFGLEKNIPAGAGMGGGSTDAAAALMLLNSRFRRLSDEQMMETAGEIGADVPFCMRGGMAICRGTGDRITPIESVLSHSVLIVNAGIHVSTAKAYRSMNRDSAMPCDPAALEDEIEAIRKGAAEGDIETIAGRLANDFEGPVFREHPELPAIKRAIVEGGAVYSAMTGSGSSIIGLFRSAGEAERVSVPFRRKGWYAMVTGFVGGCDAAEGAARRSVRTER
jgi:4-diphosphocytidyl-2-C-methyl-D-erythritol kinase